MDKDIVSTKEEDKPLIYISEEAINFKRDNDKYKKEIERLKEMKLHTEKYASEMEDKYILEKSKNDKAIEYMERYMFSQKENYDYIHLLDILKGVDKE